MAAKWIVPKELLESAISLIENVPTRNGIKSSEFIKVSAFAKDGATFSLSSDLAAKAILHTGEVFPFKEDLFIDRRLFSPFVSKGKESKTTDYIFIEKGDSILVRHGNRRAVYAKAKELTGYEDPKIDGAITTMVGKKWTSIVDCAENCATSDPITPSLNCVYLLQTGKFIEAMASNQRVVFYGKVETDKKPFKGAIAFPLLLVPTLRQEGATKLHWTDKLAVVEFPKGKVWQAVKTEAKKSFPEKDIRKMVALLLSAPMVLNVASNTFVKAVDRIASYVAPLSADDLALEIHLEKGSKRISIIAGPAESKFTETIFSVSEAKEDLILDWPLAEVLPVILYSKDEGNIRVHRTRTGKTCIATKTLTLVIPARSK